MHGPPALVFPSSNSSLPQDEFFQTSIHLPFNRGLEPLGESWLLLSLAFKFFCPLSPFYVQLLPYIKRFTASKLVKFTIIRTFHQHSCLWDPVYTLLFLPPILFYLWRSDYPKALKGFPPTTCRILSPHHCALQMLSCF